MGDKKRLLCITFAGDGRLSQGFVEAFRNAGFEVMEITHPQVWPPQTRFDGVVLFGLGVNLVTLGHGEQEHAGIIFLDYVHDLYPNTLTIVVTGHASFEVMKKIKDRGAVYYLRSYDPAFLVDLIRERTKCKTAPK
jgi:hypothetical protein